MRTIVRTMFVALLLVAGFAAVPATPAHAAQWWGWEPLYGPPVGLNSAPSAASWGWGHVDVFARGNDGELWHRWYFNDSGWWPVWEPLGRPLSTPLASAPAVVSWGPGRIDAFARGVDNQLWHTWFDNNSWVMYWEPLGGNIISAPAVISRGSGKLDVFATWNGGSIRHAWYDAGWHGWESLGSPTVPVTGPAAGTPVHGRFDVMVRGSDGYLYHTTQTWDTTCCHAWLPVPSGGLASGVGTSLNTYRSVYFNQGLDVFGRGPNGTMMWRTMYVPTIEYCLACYRVFTAWDNLGPAPGPNLAPAAVSWGPGRRDLFVLGSDQAVHHNWWN